MQQLMTHGNGNGSSRDRVLDTAQQLFHERGYQSVTMKDIARELGMRQASLYYHVPDGKEQLFVEVAARTFDLHRQGLETALAASAPDLEAQLLAAAAWFASQPPMYLLSMMHIDMPALSRFNTEELSAVAYRSLFHPLNAAFQAAIDGGQIRNVQPELLSGAFLALIDGLAYTSENQPTAPPRDIMAKELISVLLDGLHPRQAQNKKGEK